MKLGIALLLAVLASSLIGNASAGSPFERGIRTTLGPSLPKDSPPATAPSVSPPAAPALSAAPPSATPQSAAPTVPPPPPPPPAATRHEHSPSGMEQATAISRDTIQMVDPSMRPLLKRQELRPNRPKDFIGGGAPAQPRTPVPKQVEKNTTPSDESANVGNSPKEIQRAQSGSSSDSRLSVGKTD